MNINETDIILDKSELHSTLTTSLLEIVSHIGIISFYFIIIDKSAKRSVLVANPHFHEKYLKYYKDEFSHPNSKKYFNSIAKNEDYTLPKVSFYNDTTYFKKIHTNKAKSSFTCRQYNNNQLITTHFFSAAEESFFYIKNYQFLLSFSDFLYEKLACFHNEDAFTGTFTQSIAKHAFKQQTISNIDFDYQITAREWECFKYYIEGLSYKEMANVMDISEKTISIHLTNLKMKTAIKSANDLYKLYSIKFETNFSPIVNTQQVTLKQAECLKFHMQGESYEKISDLLNISEKTILSHLYNLKRKTACWSIKDLYHLNQSLISIS